MNRPLVIISRNPDSYLAGHSIFTWQLCEFLGLRSDVPVVHITHAAVDGPQHAVRITPPISASSYRRIEVVHRVMTKVPRSMGSCDVADALYGVLEEEPAGLRGVLAISPLNYLADVVNLCRPLSLPVVSLLRGTDTLVLGRSWGASPAGRRYRTALDACGGVFTVSRWLGQVARQHGVWVSGVVPPVTFHPFSPDMLELDADRLLERLFPEGCHRKSRLVVFASRFSKEKGVIQVACMFNELLKQEPSLAVVMAGSGPERRAVETILADSLAAGRAWTGPLSFPEVLSMARRATLMVMGSGLEEQSKFTEAISSSSVTFASAGVPILFRPGPRSGGIEEAVGEENRRWCALLSDVSGWPVGILDLLQDSGRYERIAAENRTVGRAFDIRMVVSRLLDLFGITPSE